MHPNFLNEAQAAWLDTVNRFMDNEITVEYTGTRFVVRVVIGDVYVNNRTMTAGDKLNGAMVITLGAPAMRAGRTFITFDISHPEILV